MTRTRSSAATFWERTEADLAETGPDVSLAHDAFYSQPEWDVYRMLYFSSGSVRLTAWLSVPKGLGPHPALIRMPDYASVHDIIFTPLRHQTVVMNATHRGQRNSDAQVRARYPGLLTDGIESAQSYTLLAAYADALRAVDSLESQSRFDIGSLALTGSGLGGSLALATAFRRPQVVAVAADMPLPLGHTSALETGLGYPLGELGDYLRMYPTRMARVEQVLSVLNPMHVAESVSVPVLLSAGRFDRSTCPIGFAQELAECLPTCDLRLYDGASEGGGHEHAQVRTAWLSENLGLGRRIPPVITSAPCENPSESRNVPIQTYLL